MPSITVKTLNSFKKRQPNLKNGFRIDTTAYVIKHSNELYAKFNETATNYVRATIYFASQFENHRETGLYNVVVNISTYHTTPGSDTHVSHGLGQTIVLTSGIKRRLVKHLDEATALVDAAFINTHINTVQQANGRIL